MKFNKFNKIGGTEYRIKDQIKGYTVLIKWLLEYQKDHSMSEIDKTESAFREYCLKEELYDYTNNKISSKKISRFKMIIGNLSNDLSILKFDDKTKKYMLSKDFDFNNPSNSFLYFLQHSWKGNNFPFQKMLEFMHKYRNLNDAKKIAKAFMVYDGKEDFKSLYETDIIQEIVNHEFYEYKMQNTFKENIHFRKPPSCIKTLEKIFNRKIKNEIIQKEDFKDYTYENDDFIKKIINPASRSKFDSASLDYLVFNLNKINLTDFLKLIRKRQLAKLLEGDYLDLFNRWMYGVGLAESSSKKIKNYLSEKISFVDGKYIIQHNQKKLLYPFSFEDCIWVLNMIQEKKYIDIKEKFTLSSCPNSVLAEYFVNLFFCYKWNIRPSDFKKYVNTLVNENLLPIWSASGGRPDMCYVNETNVFCVETTMISNQRQILMSEALPCVEHLYKSLEKNKIKLSNNFLYFVNYYDNEEYVKKLKNLFGANWENLFKDNASICKLNVSNFSFKELSKNNFIN